MPMLRWSLLLVLPAILLSGCVHHHQSPGDVPLPVRVGFKHPVRSINGLPANHPDGVVLDYARDQHALEDDDVNVRVYLARGLAGITIFLLLAQKTSTLVLIATLMLK